MARKITTEAIKAFFEDSTFSKDNTTVTKENEWLVLRLHGTAIARRRGGLLEITHGGWKTQTTRERLNAVCQKVGGSVWQEKHVWYCQTKELEVRRMDDDDWVVVDAGSPMEQFARGIRDAETTV